jgi:hypothetical protein
VGQAPCFAAAHPDQADGPGRRLYLPSIEVGGTMVRYSRPSRSTMDALSGSSKPDSLTELKLALRTAGGFLAGQTRLGHRREFCVGRSVCRGDQRTQFASG